MREDPKQGKERQNHEQSSLYACRRPKILHWKSILQTAARRYTTALAVDLYPHIEVNPATCVALVAYIVEVAASTNRFTRY